MAIIINGNDCECAYISTCQHLLGRQQCRDKDIVVNIANPTDFSRFQYCLENRNPWIVDRKYSNIRNVVSTIFPFRLAQYYNGNRPGLYAKYLNTYRHGADRKWGTYFQRFICYGRHYNANAVNQLENIIVAFNGNASQRHFAIMHTTSANVESNVRRFGGPCLQYVQFNIGANGTLDMAAVYRNQDYFDKALGNFYGLSYLLNFVITNTQFTAGELTIYATHAYSSDAKYKLQNLIN